MDAVLPIEFYLEGIPVSLQSSKDGLISWKKRVEDAANAVLPTPFFLVSHNLGIEIIVLLDDDMDGDLDNIIKPIQDAMNRVVYEDDKQIHDIRVSKVLPDRLVRYEDPSLKFAEALDREKPLVYIKIHEDI